MKEYIVRYETEQIENSEFFYGGKVECELIRCKDCKYYKWEIDMCNLPGATVFPMNVVHEDDYCSRAERKDKNDSCQSV